jgi:hypothetical protein
MSEAAEYMACPQCERLRPQVFSVPQFTEDRVRFFKGPMGNGYSTALGEQMPDSRQARDRRAREKGVEFVTLSEHLAENKEAKEAVEYSAHVRSGGDRTLDKPAPTTSPFVPKPDWAKSLGI